MKNGTGSIPRQKTLCCKLMPFLSGGWCSLPAEIYLRGNLQPLKSLLFDLLPSILMVIPNHLSPINTSHFSHHFPCSFSSSSRPNALLLWCLLKTNNVSPFQTLISLLPTVVPNFYVFWLSQTEGEMRVNFPFPWTSAFLNFLNLMNEAREVVWLFQLGPIPQFNPSSVILIWQWSFSSGKTVERSVAHRYGSLASWPASRNNSWAGNDFSISQNITWALQKSLWEAAAISAEELFHLDLLGQTQIRKKLVWISRLLFYPRSKSLSCIWGGEGVDSTSEVTLIEQKLPSPNVNTSLVFFHCLLFV